MSGIPAGRPASSPTAWILALLLGSSAGCASFMTPAAAPRSRAPELRFVTRADLGMAEQLPMDVVYTVHPGIRYLPPAAREAPETQSPFQSADAFRAVTQGVLTEAFHSAIHIAPGSHLRIEDLRRALPEKRKAAAELPSLSAKALILVDFRPPQGSPTGLGAQLAVKVYDISYTRYEELSLFNPRLLIFEDFAEVRTPETPARAAGSLVMAWREILDRLRSSDRFRRYSALGGEPLAEGSGDGALLLGIIASQRAARSPDPRGHEWIEREILFPPLAPGAASASPAQPTAEGESGAVREAAPGEAR